MMWSGDSESSGQELYGHKGQSRGKNLGERAVASLRALEHKVYLEGAAERDRERQSPRALEREPVENAGLDIGGASQNGKIEGS